MAADAQELLRLLTRIASRPPSPTPSSTSNLGAHSSTRTDSLPSVVPRVNTQSASNTLADYTVPLKSPAASRPVTRPTTPTAPRSNSSIPPEIIQEIKTSNLILNQVQRQQRETHIRLAQINNSINNPQQSSCSWSSFFIIVLQLITIVFLIYYIFSNTD